MVVDDIAFFIDLKQKRFLIIRDGPDIQYPVVSQNIVFSTKNVKLILGSRIIRPSLEIFLHIDRALILQKKFIKF